MNRRISWERIKKKTRISLNHFKLAEVKITIEEENHKIIFCIPKSQVDDFVTALPELHLFLASKIAAYRILNFDYEIQDNCG